MRISIFLIWTSEKVGSQHWGSMFFLWLSENSQMGINNLMNHKNQGSSEKWQNRIGNNYFSCASEKSKLGGNQCFSFETWEIRSQNLESPCFSFELGESQHWESVLFIWPSEKSRLGINISRLSKWEVRNWIWEWESMFLNCKWEMTGQNWESLFLICKWEVQIGNQCFSFKRWEMRCQNCEFLLSSSQNWD